MTAYAYLRKSSVRDPSREISHEVQEASVRALAERHGDAGDLVLLSDWDKSGRLGPDKRPGYRALLEAIESGQATAIYSYSMSRLARSVPEMSRLAAQCLARGIPVRLDRDAFDTSTASGMLLVNVLASVAQFEADVASERVRAAIAAKAAKGERIGTVPFYGDKAGEDVGAVLAAFRDAGSYSGAARLLNQRGIPTRTSRRGWWPSAVAVIIKRLDPTATVGKPSKGARAGGSAFTLGRLLRCPTCDTLLSGTRDRNESRVRYACRLGSVTPHERVSVSEHLIMDAVVVEVARFDPDSHDAEVDELDVPAERQRLEAEREAVLDMYQHGEIKRPELERRMAGIADSVSRLDGRVTAVEIPPIEWSWDPHRLNKYLRGLFDRIDLDPATFQPVDFLWAVPEWRR